MDDRTPLSSSTNRSPLSRWPAETLLAAGFIAGCLIARSRVGRVGLWLAAAGAALSFARSKKEQPMSPPMEHEFVWPDVTSDEADSLSETDVLAFDDAAPTFVAESIAPFHQDEEAALKPAAQEAPVMDQVSTPEPKPSSRPLIAPLRLSDMLSIAAIEVPAPVSATPEPEATIAEVINEPAMEELHLSEEKVISEVMSEPELVASEAPAAEVETTEVAAETPIASTEQSIITPNVEAITQGLASLVEESSEEVAVVETMVSMPDETVAESQPLHLADVAEEFVKEPTAEVWSDDPAPHADALKAEPIPDIVVLQDVQHAEVLPFHFDAKESAAWLLGLEPIPVVQDEPAWRKPLLAGVQSAFEGLEPKLKPIANESTPPAPSAVEAITPVAASEGEAPLRPSTKGLLGKLLEAPSKFLKPATEPLTPAPAASEDALRPAFEPPPVKAAVRAATAPSWLNEELRDQARRPALSPAPVAAEAAAMAVSLATASPARRAVPRAPATSPLQDPEKKSWLGMWK